MATKVTDFIPQSSWISKWFNTSQSNEDALENRRNIEETELDDVQQPPSKRSRIRMDVIHPPGTFSIQTRVKTALNTVEPSKEQYSVHNEMVTELICSMKYLEIVEFCLLELIYRRKILQQLDQVE